MTVADTDFFIDLMDASRAHHEGAHERAEEHAADGRPLSMTPVTRFELFTGTERYVEPAEERARVQELLDRYASLPLSPDSADRAGKIHGRLHREGQPIGGFDALIAGVALEHGQAVLTRNVDAFERVQGLKVKTY